MAGKKNAPQSNDYVSIQMMESFHIKVNGYNVKPALLKSRKGLSLIQYLILANGQPVQNQRLLYALWPDERNANPENAMKTLISRVRTMLNQVSDGLGKCIVATHGAYQWVNQPNVSVDALTIEFLLDRINQRKQQPEQSKPLYAELLHLYEGDFMQNEDVEQDDWILSRIASIHMRYITAIYDYIDILRQEGNYDEICVVCRKALEVNSFDDRLHMEIIDALVKTNRQNEAMTQYKTAEQLKYHYLGTPLSEELRQFYQNQILSSQTIDLSLEAIEADLNATEAAQGAYICEYPIFKDTYSLQARNAERMGSTMNLAVIQVADTSGRPLTLLDQDNLMQGLMDILKHNLRKGDLVTRYNATTIALMLPMQDPGMGKLVLERIRYEFYRRYATSSISFLYRVQRIQNGPAISNPADLRAPLDD